MQMEQTMLCTVLGQYKDTVILVRTEVVVTQMGHLFTQGLNLFGL